MFQHLVVALDGSESSLKAFDAALDLAARANAQLDLVSVEEELPRYSSAREEAERERAAAQTYFSRIHADARRRAQNKRVTLHAEILAGHEAQTLMDFVRARRADLLVIGHKGHSGVWGAFLGSTASSIVTHAPCSVFVHRAKNEVGFKRLLVAHDGSPLSRHALQHALELAKLCGASLTALTVVEGASDDLRIPASIRQLHEAVVEQARAAGVELQVAARGGHAAQAIVDFARQGDFDLILAGATGQERPWSATAGGTAQRVAQEALCAVLLARPLRLAQRVQDVMAREVSTVAPQTPLPQVVELLIRRGVKAVPVVDEHARVVGIITGDDLLARGNLALHEQMRALAAGGTRSDDARSGNDFRGCRFTGSDQSHGAAQYQAAVGCGRRPAVGRHRDARRCVARGRRHARNVRSADIIHTECTYGGRGDDASSADDAARCAQ